MSAKTVHFLSVRTFPAHCATYPLRVFRAQLREHGLRIRIHHGLPNLLRVLDGEPVFVLNECFRRTGLNRNPPSRLDVLEKIRPRTERLVWMDVSDATTTTNFEVLPLVDVYAKSVLLKERERYTEPFYSHRIHSQYIHERFGIEDPPMKPRPVARREDLSKLRVSWNFGLGDYTTFTRWGRRVRRFWPFASYSREFTPSDVFRSLDLCCRISTRYGLDLPTVTFHREDNLRVLDQISRKLDLRAAMTGVVDPKTYRKEMRSSRILPSPFGLGELCYRDFEVFRSGGTLLKPSLDHLETWPDVFRPWATYVPYSWDLSDLGRQIEELHGDRESAEEIGRSGQEVLLLHLGGPTGGDRFARQVTTVVGTGEKRESNRRNARIGYQEGSSREDRPSTVEGGPNGE